MRLTVRSPPPYDELSIQVSSSPETAASVANHVLAGIIWSIVGLQLQDGMDAGQASDACIKA